MRKSRFTDEQIVEMLRETERESVAAVAKQSEVEPWPSHQQDGDD